jgi:hypothetical protein
VKLVKVGTEKMYVNDGTDEPMPPGVKTRTIPDDPSPTDALMSVGEATVKDVTSVPPIVTVVAPRKFVPVIATSVPVPPVVGVKLVTVGGRINMKPEEVVVPPSAVTSTLPLALPGATTAVICVAETTANVEAKMPPKRTTDVPAKFVPVIVTVVPAPAVIGEKPVIVGGAEVNIKPVWVAVFAGVVTLTLPLRPAPTTASIWVEETTV